MKQQRKKETNKDALLAELDLHKTEFASMREEILQLLESERQYLYLSLVAFGAGLGLTPFISNQKAYIILLLFPLVFHVLLWEMLKSVESVGHIAAYLVTRVVPRVNEILDLLGSENRNMEVLGWEGYIHSRPFKISRLIALSFTPSRHWVPILSVGTLLIVYALLSKANNYVPSTGELGLVAINLLLLIWAAVQNAVMMRSFDRETKSNKE